ncbi:MAG: hypothetical protein J5I98_28045 [Phaeodactylibacter sp.]|nr:hypothetical protein [Phaeodactylibacter sp.]
MLNEKKFKELFERDGSHLVSIFIPTYRANHAQEDRLRLKNALKEAARQLEERGMNKEGARSYLRSAYELVENERFFSGLSDGLCLFIDENYFHHETLPVNFTPYVYTGRRFYLRPVLPVLTGRSRFFLLALSQNEIRFFEGRQHSITPAAINGRVEVLYVNKEYHTYGHFDEQRNAIVIHEERRPDSRELLGMAAVQTYLQGGRVHLLERSEMPVPTANLNAIYRY